MPRRDFHRAELDLEKLERELKVRLCAELRQIAAGLNTHFFFTADHNPHNLPAHYLSETSDELLKIARQTVELRKLLALPEEKSIGRLFKDACIESADLSNPHRLGPRRLAARLLTQIEGLVSSPPASSP